MHDARHTASTVLFLLGVPERIVMAIMGWSSTSMAQRYQHITEPMLNDVGKKIGAALWGSAADDADAHGESAVQLGGEDLGRSVRRAAVRTVQPSRSSAAGVWFPVAEAPAIAKAAAPE
ncbi:tyrosine-type recombinase/integrase [Kitasatospora cystarginea]|uniref:tyrosine-type recombinase/integrase n=1 Tax=Kitasatospora cystarginea TaxID=58350 RepID=UPI0031D53EB4